MDHRSKLLALLLLASAAHTQTIVVTPNDSIQDAIDAATNGTEILVLPGVYNEQLSTLGKSLTLRGVEGPEVTVLDGTGLARIMNCWTAEPPDTLIEGFRFRNAGTDLFGMSRALYIHASSPTVRDCIFENNMSYDGGAVTVVEIGAWPRFEDCVFRNNAAQIGGAFSITVNARADIVRCTFLDNTATMDGGALNVFYPIQVDLAHCLFAGNSAGGSGGAVRSTIALNMVNCTLANNTAAGSGGALAIQIGTVDIANSILYGNVPNELSITGGTLTAEHSLIAGGWPGLGNLNLDPMFRRPSQGDYRLLPNSPAIDSGDNTALPASPLLDLDGLPRFYDSVNSPDSGVADGVRSAVDRGAFEFQRRARREL